MSVLSKAMFYHAMEGRRCEEFCHPPLKSCSAGFLQMIRAMSRGTAKFCLALACLQILARGKHLKKAHLASIFEYNIRLFGCGVCMGISMSTLICLQSQLIGRFSYYTVLFLPGLISGLSIFLVPAMKRYIFISSVCCAALETLSLTTDMRYIFTKTIIFMLVNSAFMYYLRLWKATRKKHQAVPELWFFSPQHSSEDGNNEKSSANQFGRSCDHIHSCLKNIMKETSKYFWCGAAIESARIMVTNFSRVLKNPKSVFKLLCRKSSLQLALFAASYVFLHKVTNCALCYLRGKSTDSNALIAGFVSGLAFYFRPSVTISITVIVNLIHVLWRYFSCNDRFLGNFPTSEFLFAICLGYLFHQRLFDPSKTSIFFVKLISVVSEGRLLARFAVKDKLRKNIEAKKQFVHTLTLAEINCHGRRERPIKLNQIPSNQCPDVSCPILNGLLFQCGRDRPLWRNYFDKWGRGCSLSHIIMYFECKSSRQDQFHLIFSLVFSVLLFFLDLDKGIDFLINNFMKMAQKETHSSALSLTRV